MHEDAPPLKVWAYSAIAVFTLLLLFIFYTYYGFGPYAKVLEKCHLSLKEALIENNTKDTSAISVVILGSSLTERALVDPQALEDALSRETKKNVNILRIAIYYMNMDLAERINFFGAVSEYPPTYLFIENFAINLDDDDSTTSITVPIDAALLDLRNRFRGAIGLPPHENYYNRWYTFDSKPPPDHEFYTRDHFFC